ncbi:MAG: hypothetical protein AB1428_11540 [Bacteroidota bacterium]
MLRSLCTCLVTLPLLWSPARTQGHSVYLTPLLSVGSYHSLGFDNGLSFGASLRFAIVDPLSVECSALFGTTSASFDLVGSTGAIDVRTASYAATLVVRVLGHREGGELAAALGGGAVVSSVDARIVSLGALGSIAVPSRSESRSFLTAGISASLTIAPRIAIVTEPRVRFMTPVGSTGPDYHIAGGIRVALF